MEFKFLTKKDKRPNLNFLNFILNLNRYFFIQKFSLNENKYYDIYLTKNRELIKKFKDKYPSSLFILLSDSIEEKNEDNVFILHHPFKENFYKNYFNIITFLKKIQETNFNNVLFQLAKTKSLSRINEHLSKIGFKLYKLRENSKNKKISFLLENKNQLIIKNNKIIGFCFLKNKKIYFFKSLWHKSSNIDHTLIKNFFNELKEIFFNTKKSKRKIISIKEKEIFLGDHIGEGLFILNKNGNIIFHNKIFENLFSDTNSCYLEKIKAYFNVNRINQLLKNWKINKEPIVNDIEIISGSEIKSFNITLSPVIEKSKITHICAIIRDTTLQKKLEHELKISNLKASLMNNKLIAVQNAIIHGFSKLSEYKDKETSNHLERIQNYVKIIAYELYKREIFVNFKNEKENYLTEDYVEEISISSLLHDIGKVGVPDHILLKPDRLTQEEFEYMKLHTKIGGDTLKAMDNIVGEISILALAKDIAYYHHERWNGTGYPFGIRKNQIPLSARIVALCDVYDALTSERPYKMPYTHEKACEIIYDASGSQFDPLIVSVFSSVEKQFNAIRNKFKD